MPENQHRETQPLVSVVIPVYKAAEFLEEALESVLAQDYPHLDIIVVDDGSSDDSLAILQRFADRIRILTQQNRGPAAARNLGVRVARGSLLAFHDADDVWLPGKLRAQVDYLCGHPEIGIVFGQFAFWRPDTQGNYPEPAWFFRHPESWAIKQPLSGWIYFEELHDSQIAMITPIVRREIFDLVGEFDEVLEGGSDYDFWLRATYVTKCHMIETCLALYRLHGDSVSTRVRHTNYPYLVLKRAVDRHGLMAPDGRQVPAELIEQRLASAALDFSAMQLRQGTHALYFSGARQYFLHAGFSIGSLTRFLDRNVRAVAKRALTLLSRQYPGRGHS